MVAAAVVAVVAVARVHPGAAKSDFGMRDRFAVTTATKAGWSAANVANSPGACQVHSTCERKERHNYALGEHGDRLDALRAGESLGHLGLFRGRGFCA